MHYPTNSTQLDRDMEVYSIATCKGTKGPKCSMQLLPLKRAWASCGSHVSFWVPEIQWGIPGKSS